MDDDIVTRLQAATARCWCAEKSQGEPVGKPFFRCESCDDQLQAADEIERLRAELFDWERTVRAHEAENDELHDDLTRLLREVGRLREQIERAHNIIGSEAMIWLIVGANHPKAHLDAMRSAVNTYWEMYGNAFRGPDKENDRG